MPVRKDYAISTNMPQNLTKLRNDEALCDVILRSGLREIYAHRIILVTLSDYFSVLFKYEGGFEKPAIDFDEDMITGECLQNIVDYAYTGEFNICEENVCDLLLASDYFDIPFIKTKCEKFLNHLQTKTRFAMPVRKDYTISTKMPQNLVKLRNDKALCDVILRSGLREVYAHRIILVTLSDYFSLLFKYEGGFEKPAIDFDENMITGECLQNIVDYAYTGEFNICEENVCDLLLASDYFDIPFIKTECEQFLSHLQTEIINFENLPNLIWIVCHFNLKAFLEPICKFVSTHFAEVSERNILLTLSPHSLLTLLQEKDLTVLYDGVPADDVEFELFKLVVCFINGQDITDDITIKLLHMIQLTEITHEQFSSVVESSRYIQKNETITRVFNFRALPLSFDEEDVVSASSVERKYSRQWKYVDGLEMSEGSTIELDDRVCKIKIYKFAGSRYREKSPISRRYPILRNDSEEPTSVKGFSLTYQSGKTVKIGDTSQEPVMPFANVCPHEFILVDNEVIVRISKTLNTIKFVTNLGTEIGPIGKEVNSYSYLQMVSSTSDCGYFHSFGKHSTIDNLKFLWVEYSDPRFRQNLKTMQNVSKMALLQSLSTRKGVDVDFDDEDDYDVCYDDWVDYGVFDDYVRYYDDYSPYYSNDDY